MPAREYRGRFTSTFVDLNMTLGGVSSGVSAGTTIAITLLSVRSGDVQNHLNVSQRDQITRSVPPTGATADAALFL
jgi:hypothetical protein